MLGGEHFVLGWGAPGGGVVLQLWSVLSSKLSSRVIPFVELIFVLFSSVDSSSLALCLSALPSPMNFLEDTQNKGLAIAVFGILFSSLCVLLLDNDPLPFISNSSVQNREYWKVLALFYYPAFYYPLLACATVRHRVGYLLGCLLSWCHCVLYIWQKVECPQSSKIYRYYSLLSYLPIILCLAVLSLWYPVKLVESFKRDARMDPGSRYYEGYLKHILAKRTPKKSHGFVIAGFQIPLKLVLSLAMAVIAVYQVSLLLLASFIPNIQIIRAGMTKEMTALFVQFGLIPSEKPPLSGSLSAHSCFAVCFITSLVLSCLVTFCMLMKSLGNHRTNLQCLYRGAVENVFYRPCKLQPSQQSLVCWMQFTGFQISFACLASCVHWRMRLYALLVAVSASFFCRRAFYIVTYMFFPINVLLGLMAGIWRLVISALYNIVHFCQLDGSLLSRGVEGFDPGHRTYCQYLKIEVSQSHPAMKAFCLLLLRWQSAQNIQTLQLRDAEEGIKLMKTTSSSPKAPKGQQNRVRWRLAYTLLNNPSLLPYRKGALVDATVNETKASLTKP
uniref:Receptor for retinol uptake STRA6 n=1 Tax=Pseudonaja textilis TaxID=8673 RepID=A0A670YD63_PSETE